MVLRSHTKVHRAEGRTRTEENGITTPGTHLTLAWGRDEYRNKGSLKKVVLIKVVVEDQFLAEVTNDIIIQSTKVKEAATFRKSVR